MAVISELELNSYIAVERNDQRGVVRMPGRRHQEHPVFTMNQQSQVQ
jgi:hypothetical protein